MADLRIQVSPLLWMIAIISVLTGHFVELLLLFVLIIIHELGHFTAAWLYGWRLDKIKLCPFGGVMQTDEWGTVAGKEELIVALGGPFNHLLLILAGLLLNYVGLWSEGFAQYFILCNLVIAGFNLLPIYPLDGGRIMQVLLGYLLPYQLSMELAIYISWIFTCGLLFCSFYFAQRMVHLPLLISSLVLLTFNLYAYRDRYYLYMRFLLGRWQQESLPIMRIRKLVVSDNVTLHSVLRRWYKEHYNVVDVLAANRCSVGFFPEGYLLECYFKKDYARKIMRDLL